MISSFIGDPASGSRPVNVLIIGINYWPEETGNAPYTTGLAEHLAGAGYAVTVLTGMPYYPGWQVYPAYQRRQRRRERRNNVEIIRGRQYIPARQSALRRALFEGSFLAQGLTARGVPRPDVVLGVLPSLSDGVLAVAAARRFRAPLGLLVADLVGQSAAQSGIAGGQRVVGVTSAIEGWVARRADRIAIVAEGFRPVLEQFGVKPDRIERVRNWSHIRPATVPPEITRRKLGLPRDRPIALHAGNMGLKQGLENVVEAARLAQTVAPRLHFVLLGDGNQRADLEARARGLTNITFLAPLPDDAFPDALAAADVLLVNQRASVTDMSLPSKLTSYFTTGKPVVAAVAPGAAEREVAQSGGGLVVPPEDPAALVAAISRLTQDAVLASELGAAGQRFAAASLDRGAALARAEEFVGRLLARPESNVARVDMGQVG
jgi:glycosyltransferase involved in cell wall biosynthesis